MSNIEVEQKIAFQTLGEAAIGTIEPGLDQARLEEATERLCAGEFHARTDGTIPCLCVDGRCGGKGELLPNAAGGSETLMVADDLTVKKFVHGGNGSTIDQYKHLLTSLKESGHPIGGHTAVDLRGAPSGCGANDKLSAIYAYIGQNAEALRGLVESYGYSISDDDQSLIIGNAVARSEFSSGDELLKALKTEGGRVDELTGEHMEIILIINRLPGTTLNRDAVRAEFGDNYQAFNVDVWSFEAGARAISEETASEDEIRQKCIAMLYYNLAAACVLAGPNLRVGILD